MLSNRTLFLIILATSALISCTLFFGKIDPDFFNWYYIGRGIAHGAGIYRDFPGNKGPIHYLFFFVLYILFKDNYRLGLMLSSTVVDVICIYFLFRILKGVYGAVLKRNAQTILLVIISVVIYKSFSISASLGNIYSESIGNIFFLASYWVFRKKSHLYAGALFSLAILTRMTFVFFLPTFLIIFAIEKRGIRSVVWFFIGSLVPAISAVFYFEADGQLHDFIYNTFTLNLQYAEAVRNRVVILFVETVSSNLPIFSIIVFVTLFLVWYFVTTKSYEKYAVCILYLCSLKAIYPGGIFYPHHFVQFMPIFFVATALAIRGLPKTFFVPISTALGSLLLFLTLINYGKFTLVSSHIPFPQAYNTGLKKYVEVLTYHPEYYIAYAKYAPDRYFITAYLNPSFNSQSELDIARHKKLAKKRIKQTAFLAIINNAYDQQMTQSYLREFQQPFRLEKVSSSTEGGTRMELYISKL